MSQDPQSSDRPSVPDTPPSDTPPDAPPSGAPAATSDSEPGDAEGDDLPTTTDGPAPSTGAGTVPDSDADEPASTVPPEDTIDVESPIVRGAVADLAGRLGVTPDSITVVSARAVTWGDSSLGCPQPGMRYLQRLVDGTEVILLAAGTTYRYTGGSPLRLCEQPLQATKTTTPRLTIP